MNNIFNKSSVSKSIELTPKSEDAEILLYKLKSKVSVVNDNVSFTLKPKVTSDFAYCQHIFFPKEGYNYVSIFKEIIINDVIYDISNTGLDSSRNKDEDPNKTVEFFPPDLSNTIRMLPLTSGRKNAEQLFADLFIKNKTKNTLNISLIIKEEFKVFLDCIMVDNESNPTIAVTENGLSLVLDPLEDLKDSDWMEWIVDIQGNYNSETGLYEDTYNYFETYQDSSVNNFIPDTDDFFELDRGDGSPILKIYFSEAPPDDDYHYNDYFYIEHLYSKPGRYKVRFRTNCITSNIYFDNTVELLTWGKHTVRAPRSFGYTYNDSDPIFLKFPDTPAPLWIKTLEVEGFKSNKGFNLEIVNLEFTNLANYYLQNYKDSLLNSYFNIETPVRLPYIRHTKGYKTIESYPYLESNLEQYNSKVFDDNINYILLTFEPSLNDSLLDVCISFSALNSLYFTTKDPSLRPSFVDYLYNGNTLQVLIDIPQLLLLNNTFEQRPNSFKELFIEILAGWTSKDSGFFNCIANGIKATSVLKENNEFIFTDSTVLSSSSVELFSDINCSKDQVVKPVYGFFYDHLMDGIVFGDIRYLDCFTYSALNRIKITTSSSTGQVKISKGIPFAKILTFSYKNDNVISSGTPLKEITLDSTGSALFDNPLFFKQTTPGVIEKDSMQVYAMYKTKGLFGSLSEFQWYFNSNYSFNAEQSFKDTYAVPVFSMKENLFYVMVESGTNKIVSNKAYKPSWRNFSSIITPTVNLKENTPYNLAVGVNSQEYGDIYDVYTGRQWFYKPVLVDNPLVLRLNKSRPLYYFFDLISKFNGLSVSARVQGTDEFLVLGMDNYNGNARLYMYNDTFQDKTGYVNIEFIFKVNGNLLDTFTYNIYTATATLVSKGYTKI